MKLAIRRHQLCCCGGIVECREPARSDWVNKLLADQLLTDGTQIRRAAVDQCLQRNFARGEISLFIERDFFYVGQRSAVAEHNAEITHALL